jgi:hypothetical protein
MAKSSTSRRFPNFASGAADHGFDAVEHRARHEIFYLALPCEQDSPRILKIVRKYLKPKQPIFVSVLLPSIHGLKPQKNCAIMYWKRRSTNWSSNSVLPTTAASHPSAMTLQRVLIPLRQDDLLIAVVHGDPAQREDCLYQRIDFVEPGAMIDDCRSDRQATADRRR